MNIHNAYLPILIFVLASDTTSLNTSLEYFKKVNFMIPILLLTLGVAILPLNVVEGHRPLCTNEIKQSDPPSKTLPVILLHGYKEGPDVWNTWEQLLNRDKIPFCTVSFSSSQNFDQCGLAADHAGELHSLVKQVEKKMGTNQVNVVGHSKGGLDARLYLAQNPTDGVANLIMIGTPNGGGPVADYTIFTNSFNPWFYSPLFSSFFCTPALFDLRTGAADTQVKENDNTNYYIISGDWDPSLYCRNMGSEETLFYTIEVPNDGIVPKRSVESLAHYIELGPSHHCHTDLLSIDEYKMSKEVLSRIG